VIFRSRYPDVVIPDHSLLEYVFGTASGHLDHTAVIDGPK